MSIRSYHRSSWLLPASVVILSLYSATPARAANAQSRSAKPLSRPATKTLAARRLTSQSNGAGSVSSKSFTSKTRWRSGVAQTPKFSRWASPHAWTSIPLVGVDARSCAMIAAAPRKHAKGDSTIRPWRIGSSSRIRLRPCSSRIAIGSGRSAGGVHPAWAERGHSERRALPARRRSSAVGARRKSVPATGPAYSRSAAIQLRRRAVERARRKLIATLAGGVPGREPVADLGAALAVADRLVGDHRAEEGGDDRHGRKRRQLRGGGEQGEQDQSEEEALPVDRVDVAQAEPDKPEEIEGHAAEEREGGNRIERVVHLLQGLLQAERDEDDPGHHREVEVGVRVAGQLVSLAPRRRAGEPPGRNQRHDVEVRPPQTGRQGDAQHRGGGDAGGQVCLGADPDRDDRFAERDDDDQPVALGEVAGNELPALGAEEERAAHVEAQRDRPQRGLGEPVHGRRPRQQPDPDRRARGETDDRLAERGSVATR